MQYLPVNLQAKVPNKKLGEPYLRLQLASKIPVLIPLKDAQEVLVLPVSRLTPIPNLLDGVLGVFNQRSRIFWIIDLAQILGLNPLNQNLQQYNIALVKVEQTPLGLAVDKIQGVIRLAADQIQPHLGKTDLHLVPYLKGCVLQNNEVVLVLDTAAIVNSPRYQKMV